MIKVRSTRTWIGLDRCCEMTMNGRKRHRRSFDLQFFLTFLSDSATFSCTTSERYRRQYKNALKFRQKSDFELWWWIMIATTTIMTIGIMTIARAETNLFYGRDQRCVLPGIRVWYTNASCVSIVTLDWSEITGSCNTADIVVRDRRTKHVME